MAHLYYNGCNFPTEGWFFALIIAVAVASARGSIGGGRDGKAIRRMLRNARSGGDGVISSSTAPKDQAQLSNVEPPSDLSDPIAERRI